MPLRGVCENCGRLTYNSHLIAIFSDYMAMVAKARAAFMDVRKMLQGRPGVGFGIFFPARLRISYNNEEKVFLDGAKTMDYINKNVILTTEAED